MTTTTTPSFSHVAAQANLGRSAAKPSFNPNKRRHIRKAALMAENPTCQICGIHLTTDHTQPNQAHLVLNAMSCPQHVKDVRRKEREAKIGRIKVDLTPRGAKWLERQRENIERHKDHDRRQALKKQLLETDPHCFHYGCLLDNGETGARSGMPRI